MSSYNKNHPESIQKMFNAIAKRYDAANALMSFNLHRQWNKKLINSLNDRYKDPVLLDLCSGTGDIAYEYLKEASKPSTVYLLDFSEEMLEVAKQKASKYGSDHDNIHCLLADAQSIPLDDSSIPLATVAYGIRNVKDPYKCFQEVHRVLKPGGQFSILELTQPSNPVLKLGHAIFLKTMLPLIGRFATPDKEAYHYLCNSIQAFTPPEDLKLKLIQAGFSQCSIKSLNGGIATLFICKK